MRKTLFLAMSLRLQYLNTNFMAHETTLLLFSLWDTDPVADVKQYCKSTIFGRYKIWRLGNNVPIWRILNWRFNVYQAHTYFLQKCL